MLFLLIGCVRLIHPTQAHVDWAQQQWPDTTLEILESGRKSYTQRCAECHALVPPAEHSPEEWPRYIQAMIKKQGVELSATEQDQILRYLSAASAIPVPPKE